MKLRPEMYQIILDKAINAANYAGLENNHTENLYALSALYATDRRYNFVKWLKTQHWAMMQGNQLILPLNSKVHLYHAHVAAMQVFKLAGVHGGIIHSTQPH